MLSTALRSFLEQRISTLRKTEIRIVFEEPLSGGCINNVRLLQLSDKTTAVLKWNDNCPADLFPCEAAGLNLLRESHSVNVPLVYDSAASTQTTPGFILMEHIPPRESGEPHPGTWEQLGVDLAAMHRSTSAKFGLDSNNYLGPTKQPNMPDDTWSAFFMKHRLEYMVGLLDNAGRLDAGLRSLISRFIPRATAILQQRDQINPALVHGDLWSGNMMVCASGIPALIDPAVHFADREVDLAMSELFGGFDSRFIASYNASFPIDDDYPERRDIYNLYHIFHHALLFGDSYLHQAAGIMSRYL